MKIYIVTDLEGVAGVARWDQTGADTPGYPQAVRLMTEELRACVEGIQDASPGAEIWVWDAHGCGSIDLERFPRGALLLNNGPLDHPTAFMDATFDGLFFLGQHAKAGTLNGNLAHTQSSKNYAYFKINGIELGEFGCRAALAGSLGIPTVFVSGDDKMMAEARELVPQIACAQVKVGLGPQLALHLAPEDARDLIRQVAADSIKRLRTIPPFVLGVGPFEQEIKIWGRTDPKGLISRGFEQLDATRFRLVASTLAELFV